MFSKSQAKAFFLVGTGLCAGAFILLTIDTLKRIPKQTYSQNLTDEAIRGKHLFETNNCAGCHTILGEGAYYAPELTKVYERRGESFIESMLRDPEAMYPGQRKMVQYKFTDSEIKDLIAFFKWIGEMDLNGFPAKPDVMRPAVQTEALPEHMVSETAKLVRPKVFDQMCTACHSVRSQGGTVGPALDGVGTRRDLAYIKQWLISPTSLKSDSKMPKMPLSDQDISELTSYLSQLKEVN
ncbi:MAG: nitric oxide reductase [Bdellovibrionales bacterium RIFCSPHIGHO2_01_FULL_40_29]|nr:MAG: nitric oxide reductase [Bdellovibrionales bacterium RIFCSPHIGHO2_01_FULL_40_29]OFZ34284.1 MAG: nitric oxide reductase [Bdellovibrionales bacterium RIFCSPHIGHO2_02_FULL_40_15]